MKDHLLNSHINFWRDATVPFIEARSVTEGRKLTYDKHSHDTFSVGAVTSGRSEYLGEGFRADISQGMVVLMNAGEVHACNPIHDIPWSYIMFYVDTDWLAQLQYELGMTTSVQLLHFETHVSRDAGLFQGIVSLYEILLESSHDVLYKQSAVFEFFVLLHQKLKCVPELRLEQNQKLKRAADFIEQHCTENISLDVLSDASGLSASYLVRAFKLQYGMTPHAYLINRRVLYAQTQLKQGRAIADVALDAGFTDQAHFQRVFKRMVAATPRQYTGR